MSKVKYPNIFSPQMEAIMFIILQIFFAMHADFKIGECSWILPNFSWGIFAHVTHFDQSCMSKNICWITKCDIGNLSTNQIAGNSLMSSDIILK